MGKYCPLNCLLTCVLMCPLTCLLTCPLTNCRAHQKGMHWGVHVLAHKLLHSPVNHMVRFILPFSRLHNRHCSRCGKRRGHACECAFNRQFNGCPNRDATVHVNRQPNGQIVSKHALGIPIGNATGVSKSWMQPFALPVTHTGLDNGVLNRLQLTMQINGCLSGHCNGCANG